MTCPACNADNPPENRFCERCGAALEARCPQCKAPVPQGARFCGACGQRLIASGESATSAEPSTASAPSPPPPALALQTPSHLAEKILMGRSALEGERRQVT